MVSCRPQWAVGTAIYYCHRFFARKSMKKNDRFVRPPPPSLGVLTVNCSVSGNCSKPLGAGA